MDNIQIVPSLLLSLSFALVGFLIGVITYNKELNIKFNYHDKTYVVNQVKYLNMPAEGDIHLGCQRVARFFNKNEAIETVKENQTDLHENYFNYIVISTRHSEMMYPHSIIENNKLLEDWYRYDNVGEKFIECEKPEGLKDISF